VSLLGVVESVETSVVTAILLGKLKSPNSKTTRRRLLVKVIYFSSAHEGEFYNFGFGDPHLAQKLLLITFGAPQLVQNHELLCGPVGVALRFRMEKARARTRRTMIPIRGNE